MQNRAYEENEFYELRNYFSDKISTKSWWADYKDNILLLEPDQEIFY